MKNQVIKTAVLAVLALLAFVLIKEPASAQCAMCKAASETNLQNGGGDPRGLNAGILYIFCLPYLVVFGIGFWWWSNRRKERQELAELSEEDFA